MLRGLGFKAILVSLVIQAGVAVAATPTSDSGEPRTPPRTLGNYALSIPPGYVDGMDGYQGPFGYIHIRALLPCLEPETPANTTEFHKNTMGRVLDARLTLWTPPQRTGQELLDVFLEESEKAKQQYPGSPVFDFSISDVPGTNFRAYTNVFPSQDLFALKKSNPLFLISCWRGEDEQPQHAGVPFPSCSVRERIWDGRVLLEYRYDRSFIHKDVSASLTIDRNLQALLMSFMRPKTITDPADQAKRCD
jgi:hypothetical protein